MSQASSLTWNLSFRFPLERKKNSSAAGAYKSTSFRPGTERSLGIERKSIQRRLQDFATAVTLHVFFAEDDQNWMNSGSQV